MVMKNIEDYANEIISKLEDNSYSDFEYVAKKAYEYGVMAAQKTAMLGVKDKPSFEEQLLDSILYLADNPTDITKTDALIILDAVNQLKEALESKLEK